MPSDAVFVMNCNYISIYQKVLPKRELPMSRYTCPRAHRLCEEVADALLQARLVVVVLLPGDQGQRVQNLHDDLKKIG